MEDWILIDEISPFLTTQLFLAKVHASKNRGIRVVISVGKSLSYSRNWAIDTEIKMEALRRAIFS